MDDWFLAEAMKPERWAEAIETGFDKDMDKSELRRLCTPEVRKELYFRIRDGKYAIAPPHTAQIPKDKPGEFRTVYINENIDRLLLSIVNNMLFEFCKDMIHPACKSYQRGIGCGKVCQQVSKEIMRCGRHDIGIKADLSKYFDSVPLWAIDSLFDEIEKRVGNSSLLGVVRDYYHCNLYFNEEGNLCEQFQSLKQGCAVASFLADAALYAMDGQISKLDVFYVRYSDDILIIGNQWKRGYVILEENLKRLGMKLNPKKVEPLYNDKWFKFLGFMIKGDKISLSKSRLKTFQREIDKRTISQHHTSYRAALNAVNAYLYKGDGQYSWATNVLPIINVDRDIDELNGYVMDCLRAVQTNHKRLGGLGVRVEWPDSLIARGKGRNVTANRNKIPVLEGYTSVRCMRNALLTSRAVYDTLVRQM